MYTIDEPDLTWPSGNPRRRNPRPLRSGNLTKAERALIRHVVLDQPSDAAHRNVEAHAGTLARVLRRSEASVRQAMTEEHQYLIARDELLASVIRIQPQLNFVAGILEELTNVPLAQRRKPSL